MGKQPVKQVAGKPAVMSAKAPVTFVVGPEFADTFKAFKKAGMGDRLAKALDKFKSTKEQNVTTPYGASDKPFRGDGNFQGLSHAHLTHNISLVYRLDSVHNQIKLYGFYTHDDLGTGTPPNLRKQMNVGGRLRSQQFESTA